ncbi:hypothetical protein I7I50_06423 [Histoplasma capsulatum G186AR]|uniref:Uncharacterized protein n=1 Tax=Ajellomyces capsulatus TaxID=5037 RepID=A0A8H7Z2M3_AJECA|nr:hypothetical protein I7I52_10504 [Histoplasma capsulatum]QSS67373.1 hypothetical protein I7I50_06423 [Histoplasma capsulatum G186AR]
MCVAGARHLRGVFVLHARNLNVQRLSLRGFDAELDHLAISSSLKRNLLIIYTWFKKARPSIYN